MATADPQSLARRNRELAILRHIAETLNRATDVEDALNHTLQSVVELLGLQTAWTFLLHEDGALGLSGWQDLPPALAPGKEPWCGGCSCNTLFRSGELKRAINIVQCSRLAEAEGDKRGLEFHASVPLRSEDHMLGIMNVASPGSERFTPDVLDLLGTVGYQLGTAIERARLAQQAQRLAALEERNRIAREIHDTVAQGLTAITLHLEAAEALAEIQPDRALRSVRSALALARANLEEVRRSVLDLRAAPLERHTLPEALALLLDGFREDTGITASLEAESTIERLPAPVEAAAYFVVSESLTNVAKYAGATHARVDVARREGHALVEVRDDGVGGADPRAGTGLRGLADRLAALDGRLEVLSPPGGGTLVRAELPCASS